MCWKRTLCHWKRTFWRWRRTRFSLEQKRVCARDECVENARSNFIHTHSKLALHIILRQDKNKKQKQDKSKAVIIRLYYFIKTKIIKYKANTIIITAIVTKQQEQKGLTKIGTDHIMIITNIIIYIYILQYHRDIGVTNVKP